MPSHVFLRPNVKMPFEELIHLKNISFSYRGDCTPVIQNLCLIINKGDRIGLIGPSGSGKSTLTDILMALLSPVSGDMSVDGQKINLGNSGFWQANIAHVPQSIYLADASIKENIAFGVPECDINFERVRTAAQQAQLSEVIEGWNNKYETSVGERGIRLSGGQRQRIGIARALYKQASVIIFDEATSALDNETEDAVMRAIDGLSPDLTLIMVAHRVTTLKKCNKIIELVDGRIKFVGDYLSISSR
jgi:ATP-binding cassette subfamily B protein